MSSVKKYTKNHEWIDISGKTGKVGITDYAQKQLGDVVYLELPEIGRTIKQGDPFGSIESVKAVSDLYCPVSGEVIEINRDLADHPEAINTDAHETWIIVLAIENTNELSTLLDVEDYNKLIE